MPAADLHGRAVDCVVWWKVARGRTATTYAPAADVSRGQMATFIANTVLASGGTLPGPSRDHFSDDDGSLHEHSANLLAAAGIVAGTGAGRYTPDAPVTRAQMARFLVSAYEYRARTTLTSTRDHFSDDDGTTHEASINKAAEAGFAAGTRTGYAPAATVTRAQMATFLARVLNRLVEQGITRPPA